jgi:pilus assembly protein CpaF
MTTRADGIPHHRLTGPSRTDTPFTDASSSGARGNGVPGRGRPVTWIPGADRGAGLATDLPGAAGATTGTRLDELVGQIRAVVSDHMQRITGEVPATEAQRRALVEQLLDDALRSYAEAAIASGAPALDAASTALVARRVRDALLELGPVQPLLDDPRVENVDLLGCDNGWVQYADGRRAQLPPLFTSDRELEDWVRQVAAHSGGDERRFDRGSPAVSVQLPDGSRLFAVMAVSARPYVSIRRFPVLRPDLEELMDSHHTLSPAMAALFTALVRARRNIVVAGGTNTGKTTFLRALAAAIPPYERIVTVEDAYELGLHDDERHPNTAALQARAANVEGAGAVDLAELVRWALRMNPDRVIVGEVRGYEVIPMCNAMSQGNDGSLCTVHASSSEQAFSKLTTYAAQGPQPVGFDAMAMLLGSAVHFVIHLDWAPNGGRVVSSVREVTGFDGQRVISNEVYRPGSDRRGRHLVPLRPQTLQALTTVGFDPSVLDTDRDGWA